MAMAVTGQQNGKTALQACTQNLTHGLFGFSTITVGRKGSLVHLYDNPVFCSGLSQCLAVDWIMLVIRVADNIYMRIFHGTDISLGIIKSGSFHILRYLLPVPKGASVISRAYETLRMNAGNTEIKAFQDFIGLVKLDGDIAESSLDFRTI